MLNLSPITDWTIEESSLNLNKHEVIEIEKLSLRSCHMLSHGNIINRTFLPSYVLSEMTQVVQRVKRNKL